MDRKPVFSRQIRMEAYQTGPNTMVAIGSLDDTRATALHTVHGTVFPAGPIHDMTLEMEVSLPDYTITAVRVRMPQVPETGCREIIPAIESLAGLNVAAGFTHEVRQRLGGPRGCAHLLSLILAMAPVIVQGASDCIEQKPFAERVEMARHHLVNSCHMWREGGYYVRRMQEQLASRQPADGAKPL